MPAIALADFLIGLIVAVLVVGAIGLSFIASRVIPDPSFLGFHPLGWVQSAVRGIAGLLGRWGDDAMLPLAFLVQGTALTLWWIVATAVNTIEHAIMVGRAAYTGAVNVASGLAQDVFRAEQSDIHNLEAQIVALYSTVLPVVKNLQSQVATLEGQIPAEIAAGVATAETGVESIIASTTHSLESQIATVLSQLASVDQALTGGLSTAVAGLRAEIATAEADAVAGVNAAIATAEAVASTLAGTAAAGAVGLLNGAAHDVVVGPWQALLPDLEAVAGALDPAVVGALGLTGVLSPAVPATIPGILSLIVPAIGAITTEMAQCVVPTCDTVKGLSGLLQGLTDAAFLAALFALLAELASDPGAAASDIVSTVAGPVNGALGGFRSLLGV